MHHGAGYYVRMKKEPEQLFIEELEEMREHFESICVLFSKQKALTRKRMAELFLQSTTRVGEVKALPKL